MYLYSCCISCSHLMRGRSMRTRMLRSRRVPGMLQISLQWPWNQDLQDDIDRRKIAYPINEILLIWAYRKWNVNACKWKLTSCRELKMETQQFFGPFLGNPTDVPCQRSWMPREKDALQAHQYLYCVKIIKYLHFNVCHYVWIQHMDIWIIVRNNIPMGLTSTARLAANWLTKLFVAPYITAKGLGM